MIAAFLLLSAAASDGGAQATAQVHVRVVRGERLDLVEPASAPDRQFTVRKDAKPEREPMPKRLIEFH